VRTPDAAEGIPVFSRYCDDEPVVNPLVFKQLQRHERFECSREKESGHSAVPGTDVDLLADVAVSSERARQAI